MREISFHSGNRLLNPSARMQGDGINIGISRALRVELAGFVQFGQRLVIALETHKREAERMMKAGISRCRENRVLQNLHAFPVASPLPVEIGKIDRGGRKLRTEPQGGDKFLFGASSVPALNVERAQRRAGFRTIGIEALCGNKLGCCAVETVTIRRRLS